mgnify:CR=1 FL=1|tara:strand:- start:384 stop:743 length:360 start_codon:yes stop_codon:yes gene_type:complete
MYDIKEVVIDFAAINEQKKELNEEQLNEFLFSTTAALGGSIKVLLGMMGMGDNFGVPVKIKGNRQEVNSFMRALKGERRYMDSVKKFGLDDPYTYKNKFKLNKAIEGFERTTGMKWMIE